jgi:hypothetical protein
MERTVITVTEYCRYHQPVEPDFIHALVESGLIRWEEAGAEPSLPYDELHALERYARLHYELDINLEGLEAISHLLGRMNVMQQELRLLREQLGLYSNGRNIEDI